MAFVEDEVRIGTWPGSERSVEEYLSGILLRESTPGSVASAIGTEIWSSKVGLLVCPEDESCWCDHIDQVVRMGLDANSIRDDCNGNLIQYLEVPVFPTDGIFGRVFIHPRKSGTFDVNLNQPMDVASTKRMKRANGPHLGLLCPGEGRMVLRNMIIDWLQGITPEPPTPVTTCGSFRHGYQRKMDFTTIMKFGDHRSRMIEAWCLYWYTKCHGCLAEEGPSVQFDADLIPGR